MNIQHSSRTDDWNTPIYILAMARSVLGDIDFDPASSAFANARVGAEYYFTKEMNALTTPWPDVRTIYCNPPGGVIGGKSQTALFWRHLMTHIKDSSNFDHAIFMAFSAEARQTTQNKGVPSIGEFVCCTPARRVCFDDTIGRPGKAPSHSNCIAYIPGKKDKSSLFKEVFSKLGCTR